MNPTDLLIDDSEFQTPLYLPVAEFTQKFEEAKHRRDQRGRFAEQATITVGDRQITVVKPRRAASDKLVPLDVARFDERFSGDRDFYLSAGGGKNAISDRYERFGKFIAENDSIESPEVYVGDDGRVGFINGRHRYAWLRDHGIMLIPVAMTAESVRHAKTYGYLAAVKREWNESLHPRDTEGQFSSSLMTGEHPIVGKLRSDLMPTPLLGMPRAQFMLPDGTTFRGKSGQIHEEAAEDIGLTLNQVLRAGVLRIVMINRGTFLDAFNSGGPMTEAQAKILADHKGDRLFGAVLQANGEFDDHAFEERATADTIRYWVNKHFTQKWDESQHPRAKDGEFTAKNTSEDIVRNNPYNFGKVTDWALTGFVLSDGSKYGNKHRTHFEAFRHAGGNLHEALAHGVVRVTRFGDGVEVGSPITEAQATTIADGFMATGVNRVYVDALLNTADPDAPNSYVGKEFENPTADALRHWINSQHFTRKWDESQHPRDKDGKFTYAPSHDAPKEGEFTWPHGRPGPMDLVGPEPVWSQQHRQLVADALQTWVGSPGNLSLHIQDVLDTAAGKPVHPSAGGDKQRYKQAEALIWELEHNATTNPVPLYRGSGMKGDAPGDMYSWSEKRSIAEEFAKQYGGRVETLPAGTARGLRLRDYTGDAFGEKQWVIRAGNDPVRKFDAAKHPRDKDGQFTESWHGNQWIKGFTGFSATLHQAGGGFTYSPVTQKAPKMGFALSIHPEREQIIPQKDLTVVALAEYVHKNADLLVQDDNYFGAWANPDDGNVYLDISTVLDSADEAAKRGLAANQLAYYDLGKGQTVEIQHKRAADAAHGRQAIIRGSDRALAQIAWTRAYPGGDRGGEEDSRLVEKFDESKHPRDAEGQFTTVGVVATFSAEYEQQIRTFTDKLTEHEAEAIDKYVLDEFNSFALDRVVSKAPHLPEAVTVFRGVNEERYRNVAVGDSIEPHSVLSTSLDPAKALIFAHSTPLALEPEKRIPRQGQQKTLLRIRTNRGLWLPATGMAAMAENELLLPRRGYKLKVMEIGEGRVNGQIVRVIDAVFEREYRGVYVQKAEYKFGNTQIQIAPTSQAAQTLNIARNSVRDEHVMGKGKDVDQNHVTVRFGLVNEDLDGLRRFIARQVPFEAHVGEIEMFPASEHSEGAVPIVARIVSPELHALEAEIGKHAAFKEKNFPEYKPHCTIAYVHPDAAPYYVDLFVHGTFVVQSITISHQSGVQETIPFGMVNKWDEAKHPRDKQGQFTEGGGALTPDDVGEHITRITRQRAYAHYGVRVDNHSLRVGQTAPISNDWSDEDQVVELKGTAAVDVKDWKRVSNYSGSDLVLLGSDEVLPGTDRSEVVMPDAVVLGVWTLPTGFWGLTKKWDPKQPRDDKGRWVDLGLHEGMVTVLHGTTRQNAEAILAGGFKPGNPAAVAAHIEAEYGLPKDSILNHVAFQFAKGRVDLEQVHFTTNEAVADQYSVPEVLQDALTSARMLLQPSAEDEPWTKEKQAAAKAWIKQEAKRLTEPALLSVTVPFDVVGQHSFGKTLTLSEFQAIQARFPDADDFFNNIRIPISALGGAVIRRRKKDSFNRPHWEEAKHPRQPAGTAGGSGGEFMATLHGPKDALDSLLNGETGVSIDRGDVRAFLKLAGQQHEDPDLTDLQVEGMEIFGGNGLGIERDDMPQIPPAHRQQFLAYARQHGVTITKETVDPLTLKPTQNAISARRVAEKFKKYGKGDKAFPPPPVSNENRILDGHHHWGMMAAFAVDIPSVKMPIYRMHVGTKQALALMHDYMKLHKLKRASLSGAVAKFDESQHPRDAEGQFTVKMGWHLTADPHFTPDPAFKPEFNSFGGDLMGDDRPAGLFVGLPEFWMHAHGYERPYVAQVEGRAAANVPLMYKNREAFLQAPMRTVRVLTIDEYAREEYRTKGWVEDYFGEGPSSIPENYVGRPVSAMSADEIAEWERKFAKYASRPDGPHPERVAKADPVTGRYVTPFVSFDKHGDEQLRMIASLNSSRLATWGFTAEAEVRGMARYRLSAVLDGRTSEFCRIVDGKIFFVEDAREKVIEVLNVQDPEDLKTVQPWPRQTKAALKEFREMSPEELTERGLHIPPYHPHCRTICRIIEGSKGEEMEEVETIPDEAESFQPVTMADLKELGIDATQEDVDQWNAHVGMSPVELLSKFSGLPPQEVMTKGQGVGARPITFDESGAIGFNVRGESPSGIEFKLGAILEPFTGIYYLTQAELLAGTPKAELAFLKSLFSSLIDMSLKSSATELAVGVAGNALYYAKMGFLPDELEWDSLRTYGQSQAAEAIASLAPEDRLLVEHLLQDKSVEAMSALVELPFTYEGRSIGEWLFGEASGTWSLDLTDDVLVAQARSYLS